MKRKITKCALVALAVLCVMLSACTEKVYDKPNSPAENTDSGSSSTDNTVTVESNSNDSSSDSVIVTSSTQSSTSKPSKPNTASSAIKPGNNNTSNVSSNSNTSSKPNNNTVEFVKGYDSRYSKMPVVKSYTDRLPDKLKINRSLLTATQKKAYDLMLPYALTFTDFSIDLNDLPKNGFTVDDMFKAGDAINDDYPETWMYWSAQYKDFGPYVKKPDGTYRIEYANFGSCLYASKPGTEYNERQIKDRIAELMKKCDEIIGEMPKTLNTREKYLWIADYLCDVTVYLDENSDSQASYADGPILRGKGICQGYSHAYQLLCQKADLWCILCFGGNHAWNVVKLDDGLTYYMDLTWQDDTEEENYYYFMSYQKCLDTGHSFAKNQWIADGKD